MKDEARFRRDAMLELKRQKRLARELWTSQRLSHVKRSGPGFARYTDKSSLHHVAIATERALNGGAVWSDVAAAIKVVAADPMKSPWGIFDQALAEQSRREQMVLQAAKLQRQRDVLRGPQTGLRPLGKALDQVMSSLKPDAEA
jgi:hypothetical protein